MSAGRVLGITLRLGSDAAKSSSHGKQAISFWKNKLEHENERESGESHRPP